LGILAVASVLGGTAFVQLNYAFSDRVVTQDCIELGITPDLTGAVGVCSIVEGLRSDAETLFLYGGILLGLGGVALGWGTYKRMDSIRRREQAVTGAILG
jgi:hypothetical protein